MTRRPTMLPAYAFQPSPNQSHRTVDDPTLLVVHYSASQNERGTLRWLRMVESKVSAHFFIGRDGAATQLVPLDRAAWHAGPSEWAGRRGCNDYSIGVELANAGLLVEPEYDGGSFALASSRDGERYHGPEPVLATLALRDGSTVRGWWEPYAEPQLAALERLIADLRAAGYAFELAGHDEIAIPCGRKIDPGPLFHWARFRGEP